MDQFDRFRPDDWSRDGVTTVTIRSKRERHFAKRPKEAWIVRTARATIISFALIAVPATALILPSSDFVQRTALSDVGPPHRLKSRLQDVEPGHWSRLIKFLDKFPQDETNHTDFDPDPFT